MLAMGESDEKTFEIAKLFGLSSESEIFLEAVTHPSFAHESQDAVDNQRLEFLGDAVLDFVVSELLLKTFPHADEGKLTRTRSQLVSTKALARFARFHQLSGALRFGKGGSQGSLAESDNVLADAVEALIAAAYLEGGTTRAQSICSRIMNFGMEAVEEAGERDAKSKLQEEVQALGIRAPAYQVVGTQGPAHEVIFEVEVSIQGEVVAAGVGRSKRDAERNAAVAALASTHLSELADDSKEEGK